MEHIIWTNKKDLSADGLAAFCKEAAARYGKREEDLLRMSPLDLAVTYMLREQRRLLKETESKLSVPANGPILVIADKVNFPAGYYKECFVLPGASLSEIFNCRKGLVNTFYSDGKDIRCEDITEDGANFYLFREVKTLKGINEFVASIQRGEPFTESQLDQYTRSLLPLVYEALGWQDRKAPLEQQIYEAQKKIDPRHEITAVPMER